MNANLHDLRLGLRMLRKNPGFTAVAILTLALGVGVNLALFARFDEELLRPLPVSKPDELWAILPSDQSGQPRFFNCSHYYYEAVREHPGAFERVVGRAKDAASFRSRDSWKKVKLWLVSGDYFDFLSVRPLLGRTLVREDERPGAVPVAVLSHHFWRQNFDEDTNVLGKTLELDGRLVEVVGVMPADFSGMQNYGNPRDLWIPASMDGSFDFVAPGYEIVGRLDKSISPKQAADSLASVVQAVTERLTRDKLWVYSSNVAGFTRVAVRPAGRGDIPPEWINVETYRTFALAAAGTLLVLLIALLNLASLALARALRRRKETATRIALGAGRWRLVRQVVTEGLMLSVIGTIGAGLMLGWVSRVLPAFMPAAFSRPVSLSLDARVLVAAAAMALLSGVVFSVLPAWRATRSDPLEALRDPDGYPGTLVRRWPWRRVLVVFQIAGSFVLLTGAVLCISAIYRQVRANVGFDQDRLVLAQADLWEAGFHENEATAKAEALRQRLAALPGVEAVGWFTTEPFHDFAQTLVSDNPNWIPGYTSPVGVQIETGSAQVGPNTLRALGVSVLQGRDMTDADFARNRLVAVVNESFVKKFWPEQPALGKEITLLRVNNYRVIGVVADARLEKPEAPARPTIYFSNDRRGDFTTRPTFVLKAKRNPDALVASVRAVLRSEHLNPAAGAIMTMRQAMSSSLYNERKALEFLGWLAATALGLTMLGIFGTVSYSVSQRTREYGVRMAIGASHRNVLLHVLRSGTVTAMAGIGAGIPLALWGAAVLRHSSYSVDSSVTPALVLTALAVMLATLAACLIPAWRATRINPMKALRTE